MSERVRNVNSTDTLRTGAAEAGADPDDENRIDFGTLFPAKGDSFFLVVQHLLLRLYYLSAR